MNPSENTVGRNARRRRTVAEENAHFAAVFAAGHGAEEQAYYAEERSLIGSTLNGRFTVICPRHDCRGAE